MRINDSAWIPAVCGLALLAAACSEPPPPPRASPAPAPVAVASPPVPPAPAEPPAAAPTQSPSPPPAATPAPVREKLGAGQCRSCHRLQYDSWVKSGHARKALDCEGCHGNGSEYAKASVMKDPARAKAAGLIFQTAAFCDKCHPTADDAFLPKAHAHSHPRR